MNCPIFKIKNSILLVLIFIAACSKNTTDKNSQPPVITIVSPLNNQHFNAGDIIHTVANASDNDRVTELHIHVINNATGALLRDIHSYPGQPTGTVQDSFSAEAGVTYKIQIIAKDPAQNLATAQVQVSVN